MALLRGATDRGDLDALGHALGFDDASPIDDDTRRALGLGAWVARARIAAAAGASRLLLLDVGDAPPMREQLATLARRLATRMPHTLWLVVAREASRREIAVAAWAPTEHGARVAALVAAGDGLADSDADTLRALAAVDARDDLLAHARRVELLGREGLSRRFYRELERRVAALADDVACGTAAERNECALLGASRLLFVAFLEAKGWLDGDRDFMIRHVERTLAAGGRLHERLLRPLFFGTLNTPPKRRATVARAFGRVPFLNGGLFAPTPLERRLGHPAFGDGSLVAFVSDLLARYNFTARETSAELVEAAIDPEMLGHAFESLMATGARRASGAFFTPFALVRRTTDAGLRAALAPTLGAALADAALSGGALSPRERARVGEAARGLTVLDPACGSGAFLVHALDRLTELAAASGDTRDRATVRRELVTRSIFGVDRNPIAVWLCQLRLWLAVVTDEGDDDPMRIAPLPNLDRNVRGGDALAGTAWSEGSVAPAGASIAIERARYARATGARKATLARRLEQLERRAAVGELTARLDAVDAARRDLVAAMRGRDLFGERAHRTGSHRDAAAELRRQARQLRGERARLLEGAPLPFSFATHFADVAAAGGFGLVVGNPPWVRPHRVPPRERARLRASFVVARAPAWQPRVDGDSAPPRPSFGAQVDLAALFVERSVELLAPGGALALLLPAKLWRSLAGAGVRRWLLDRTRLALIEDHGDGDAAFDAVVYPSLLVANRAACAHAATPDDGEHAPAAGNHTIRVRRMRRGAPLAAWRTTPSLLRAGAEHESPWLLVPREVREAFDRVRDAGLPFARTLGAPLLGIKCGCNDAFVVRHVATAAGLSQADVGANAGRAAGDVDVVGAGGRAGTLPAAMLRPVLRGEGLEAWRAETDESILWTHDAGDRPLAVLPDAAAAWLGRWRRTLERRTDARHAARWWELFRTEGARCDQPRIVWADVGRTPRAVVLDAGDDRVPLNSCYAVRCRTLDDALAGAAWLNAPLAASWLAVLAEPARGGYLRYMAWTMAMLPLPRDWPRARVILAPLAERAIAANVPDRETFLAASLEALGLRRAAAAPLLAWACGAWNEPTLPCHAPEP